MKTNKFRKVLNVLLLGVMLAGCGSDNKSGDSSSKSKTTFNTSNASGEAGTLITVEQLKAAIQNGKFSQASTSAIYYFQKESGSYSDLCWNGRYEGSFNEKYGARALNSDFTIARNFTMNRNGCSVPMSFDEDVFTGNTLQALANNIVAKINTALSVHDPINAPTVRKVVNGYGKVNYFQPNYTCPVYEGSCSQSKSISSKTWEIYINGEWLVIDLNYALIRQPILRY